MRARLTTINNLNDDELKIILGTAMLWASRPSWDFTFLRGVCRRWKHLCDQLEQEIIRDVNAAQEEIDLRRSIWLKPGQRFWPSPCLRSWARRVLPAVHILRLNVDVYCPDRNNTSGGDLDSAMLWRLLLQEAAALQRLEFIIPFSRAADLAMILPAAPGLLAMDMQFQAEDEDAQPDPLRSGWNGLLQGLRSLTRLQDLVIWSHGTPEVMGFDFWPRVLPRSLTRLHLNLNEERNGPGGVGGVHSLAHLSNLQDLALHNVVGGVQVFPPALGGLTSLSLGRCDAWLDPGSMAQLTALEALELRDTRFNQAALLSGFTGLTRLELWDSEDALAGTTLDVSGLTRLEELVLSVPGDRLRCPSLCRLTGLRRLEARAVGAADVLAALPGLSLLTSLELGSLRGQTVQVSHMQGLWRLSLQGCTPLGLAALTRLYVLHLNGCQGLECLAAPLPASLNCLAFERCGLQRLPAGVMGLGQLRLLNLEGNTVQVSEGERRWLAQQLNCPALLEAGANVNKLLMFSPW